jgi:hypothetical protein
MPARLAVLLALSTLALACAGSSKEVKPAVPPCATGPVWTCSGSGTCPAEFPESLCGVGRAENVTSYNLGMQTAETRARGAIAAVLESRVEAFNKSVQDSVSKLGEEDYMQKVQGGSESFVKATLNGVTVPRTHFDPATKVYFALAVVDAKTLANGLRGLKEAKGLSDAAKAEIDKRADQVDQAWDKARARAEEKK